MVIQEDTDVDGGGITITEAASAGRHIRPAGVDFNKGDVLLAGGTPPGRSRSVAGRRHELSGTAGAPQAQGRDPGDRRRTGDAGRSLGPGQIVYSNGYALRALARAEGADTVDLGIAADTVEATTPGIRRARDCGADILITTGGASVGDHDLVKRSLEAEGVAIAFWRIAMRPGKPMMHGRLGPCG